MKTKNRTLSRRILALFLSIMLLFSLSGCGASGEDSGSSGESSGDGKTTIRLAFPTWVGYTPLYIAKEKGFFDKYNLNVELNVIEGLSERKMAIAGGKLEGLAISADSLLNLKSADLDVKAVWVLDNSNGSDGIAAKPKIKSPTDLKGKRVAVEENMCEHFFLLTVLKQCGLSADDITIVPMNTADAGAAYIAGEVDACVVYEPYLTQCKEKGANTFTTKEYPVPLIDVFGFSGEFIKQNPEAIKNFLAAINEADNYWEENEDECATICKEGLAISEEDCKFTKSVLSIYNLEKNIELMGTEEAPGEFYDIIKDENDFYFAQKVLTKEVKPEDFIDPTFVRELADN